MNTAMALFLRWMKYRRKDKVIYSIAFIICVIIFIASMKRTKKWVVKGIHDKASLHKRRGLSPKDFTIADIPPGEVTLVTAYFDLGTFQKGEETATFSPKLYRKWMDVFKLIKNPLIAFLEDDTDIETMKKLRSNLPANLTYIVKIDRNQLWGFKLKPKIKAIFDDKWYPKHHPNTVVPEYSCAMHAKYDLIYKVSKENPFQTKYIAWLDIGVFRDIVDLEEPDMMYLAPPPFMNDSMVSYNEVWEQNRGLSPREIFRQNEVWVGGGFFIGTTEVLLKWCKEYRKFVNMYVKDWMINTDQQVIYSIKNEEHMTTPIQIYYGYYLGIKGKTNIWFYLAYLCKRAGDKRQEKYKKLSQK